MNKNMHEISEMPKVRFTCQTGKRLPVNYYQVDFSCLEKCDAPPKRLSPKWRRQTLPGRWMWLGSFCCTMRV